MSTKSYFQTFFLILVNNPKQPLHARNSLKLRYFEGGLSKSLKKGSFIFSFKKVNGQDYDEQKRPGTSAVMIFGETDFNRGFGGL